MKLGVYYNFFDGEELLEGSIKSIRDNVDHIIVVGQEVSNFGNKGNPDNKDLMTDLFQQGLIEECLFDYEPNLNKHAHFNEVAKRNYGLQSCINKGCTHILGMDADEFYIPEQFKKAKEKIIKDKLDSTACRLKTYFKKPIYQIRPAERYYVPFINEVNEKSKYILHEFSPVLVDPTRRLNTKYSRFHTFDENELCMHHMSFVRKDIRSKIMNSSAQENFQDAEAYIRMFERWKPGVKNFHPSNPKEFRDVREVPNVFGIEI